jgi:hypothetical protein
MGRAQTRPIFLRDAASGDRRDVARRGAVWRDGKCFFTFWPFLA